MAQLLSVLPKNYKEIAGFLLQYKGWSYPAEYWLNGFQVWWDENPAFSEDMERGWVLRDKQKIVGFMGLIPSLFQIFGKQIVVFNATTWYVNPQYRSESLQFLIKSINYAKNSIYFYTTPSDRALKIIQKLRFHSIPRSTCKRSFIIIDFEKVLKVKLGQSILNKFVIKIISPLLAIAQSIRLKKTNLEEINRVKRIRKADSTFDDLWERTKHIFPTTNIRNAETINWYCFNNNEYEKVVFGYYLSGQLLGYVICQDPRVKSVSFLECSDYWVSPDASQVTHALINAVYNYAFEKKYDCILFPHFNLQLENIFNEMGLFSMEDKNNNEYFKIKPEWFKKINDSNSYFAIQGDRGIL
jgi:hypothetical protein